MQLHRPPAAAMSEKDGAKPGRAPLQNIISRHVLAAVEFSPLCVCVRWIPFILGVQRVYAYANVSAGHEYVFSQAEEMDSRRRDDLLTTFALVWTSKSHPVSLHTRQLASEIVC
jgi:hypothetical protein